MRDWFGFKRRRAELKADIYEAVGVLPQTPFYIGKRVEAKRGKMVSVASLVIILHELEREGALKRNPTGHAPRYWRRQ